MKHANNSARDGLRTILPPLIIGGALLVGGCSEPGPAEQAGRELDEAAEDARDAIEDMGRDAGPAERAGREADERAEDAQETLEELRREAEEAFEDWDE